MKILRRVILTIALAAAVPAVAQDTTQIGLAKDMLARMHAADNFAAVIPAVFQALKPALTKGDAKAAKDWDAIGAD